MICGALRDISAAKQAESHLRELADEQAALRRVATLVARESSPQQLFASVAEQVGQIIDVPLVRLVRYESDGSAVELIGGWGESVDPLATGTRWQLDGPGVLASVWQSGRPARLDDYADVPGQAAVVVRQAGMRSAVASPITVEGRLWGAIAVLSPRREPLPESTEARLADFTELVATALANAENRYELAASEARARKLAEEQAALRRVATLAARESSPDEIFAVVAEEVAQLSAADVGIARYEPDETATEVASRDGRSGPPPLALVTLEGKSIVAWCTSSKPARMDDWENARFRGQAKSWCSLRRRIPDRRRRSSLGHDGRARTEGSAAVGYRGATRGLHRASRHSHNANSRRGAASEAAPAAPGRTGGTSPGSDDGRARRQSRRGLYGGAEEVAGIVDSLVTFVVTSPTDVARLSGRRREQFPVGSRWPVDAEESPP